MLYEGLPLLIAFCHPEAIEGQVGKALNNTQWPDPVTDASIVHLRLSGKGLVRAATCGGLDICPRNGKCHVLLTDSLIGASMGRR